MFRVTSIALTLIFLESCIPFYTYTYFEPSSEMGRVHQAFCYDSAGPNNNISFNKNDIKFNLSTGKDVSNKKNNYVAFTLFIPNGKSAFFPSGELLASWGNESIPIIDYQVIKYPQLGTPLTMSNFNKLKRFLNDGETLEPGRYEFKFVFPKKDYDSFDIQLPNIIIDKVSYDFSVIHFTRKTTTYFFQPINC